MPPTVSIVRTGVANVASVAAGLRRAGGEPALVNAPAEIEAAERLVLPGVGAFGAGMAFLREHGLVEPIRRRIAEGRPTLGVCLGMQLMFEASEESPGVEGIGALPGAARRFSGDGLRVPQLGWNRVGAQPGCITLRSGYAYFANSYRIDTPPEGWACVTADYAGPFLAALERGPVLFCQFHPELSGAWGIDLLARWVACAREGAPC